ncbi:MAG: Enoyl-CoA hydratase [uncultured Frankineae bacterium]|uniref:Enoyl-CoA hydratase n=1 Tax=uncultured Frankineae bacterium TaxID=437475 RepID=A0A6J4LWM5_9ACTN|nr:MAG: Enoyl-CoA hydratase [uncultured Frankineae bacterium]
MSDLQVSADGGVLRLHLDREAKRNALSAEVLLGMRAALRAPGDARAVLVTAAGDRVFCAGADLVQMAPDATGLEVHEGRGLLREVVLAMRACPVPVVASVQGLCLAGGVGLVLGCDVVLASDAAAFGLPEVDLGLWPFMVSALLARHVSPKRAMELMLSARRVSADEALDMGLVSRVVPAAELRAQTDELVAALVAKPPVAVRLGKAAFVAATETPLVPALEAMQAQLSLLNTTSDAAEGVAAFLAKRTPNWTGR